MRNGIPQFNIKEALEDWIYPYIRANYSRSEVEKSFFDMGYTKREIKELEKDLNFLSTKDITLTPASPKEEK